MVAWIEMFKMELNHVRLNSLINITIEPIFIHFDNEFFSEIGFILVTPVMDGENFE